MSTYFYTGVTAYFPKNETTDVRLSLLAEAIFQLQPFIGLHENDFGDQGRLMKSGAFQSLSANHELFTNNAQAFPQNTPKDRQSVNLSSVTVNGTDLVKFHIPVISEDQEELDFVVDNCLVEYLTDLFGDDLISVKAKSGCDSDEFHMLSEEILVSAERFAVTA